MMPDKISIPRQQAHWLHRPRLLERLHQHLDRALTLVVAFPDYGKTTLLADFGRGAPFPVGWLTLDKADRDPCTFVKHLIAALRKPFPAFGHGTQRALAIDLSLWHAPRALAGVILQDVQDSIRAFFTLILDNYHAVDKSPGVNLLLSAFLLGRPANCHLIVSG